MSLTLAKLLKYLIAILLGNGLYFALSPQLPIAAQHRSRTVDLGTIIDFWLCLMVYGLLELGASFHRDGPGRGHPKK
jgi:hypothetical protein